MSLTDRQQKQAHAALLRDRALALLRERGRPVGNFEMRGHTYRVIEFDQWPLKIELEAVLSAVIGDDTFSLMEIVYRGKKVFKIRWGARSSRVLNYAPGEWERQLMPG
jgi:hypothetical protein